MTSISQKLFKGAIWNSIAQFGSQTVNFVVILILARLLEPSDFGLVGMVTVFTIFLGYFSECGLTPSLIQKKDADEIDYNTVFWSTIVFSITIYIVVFFGAPFISLFYHEDRLTPLVRILFVSFLFAPFSFAPLTIEKKELRYRRIALAELLSLVCSGIVAIVLAFLKFGVLSLVWFEIVRVFSRSLLLMFFSGWFPKFIFSVERLKRLMKSGAHFTFSNLISYLSNNIDFLIVGKLLGPAPLGIYTLAFRISRYPFSKIWGIFGQMLFPAFVGFKEERQRIQRTFIKVSVVGGIVLIPVITFIFFGMRPLTLLLFGQKWIDIIPIVRILLIYIVLDSISFADPPLLMAFDRVKTVNMIKIGVAGTLFLLGYFMVSRFGIKGMACAFAIVSMADCLTTKRVVLKEIGITWRQYFQALNKIIGFSIFFVVCVGGYFLVTEKIWPPLIFLAGEIILMGALMTFYFIKTGAFSLSKKSFNFDVFSNAR